MLCNIISMQVCNSVLEFTHGHFYRYIYIEAEVDAWSPATGLGAKKPTLMYITFHDNEFVALFDSDEHRRKDKSYKIKQKDVTIPNEIIDAAKNLAQAKRDLDFAFRLNPDVYPLLNLRKHD